MLSLQSLLIDRHRLHADSTSYARRRVTVEIRLLRRSSSLLLYVHRDRTDYWRRGAQDGHQFEFKVALRPQRPYGLLCPPRFSHSTWALTTAMRQGLGTKSVRLFGQGSSELRKCVKEEVDVLGSQYLMVRTVSVDVKQLWKKVHLHRRTPVAWVLSLQTPSAGLCLLSSSSRHNWFRHGSLTTVSSSVLKWQ